MLIVDTVPSVFRYIAALLLIVSSIGCGYSFRGAGSSLPPEITKVYIPLVENDSVEGSLTLTLTEALKDEFDRYGVITVVDDRQLADAELIVKILAVDDGTTATSSRTDTSFQFDTVVKLDATLQKISDGKSIWDAKNIRVSRSFGGASATVITSSADFAGGPLASADLGGLGSEELTRGQQGEALERIAERAAELIYEQAVIPEF